MRFQVSPTPTQIALVARQFFEMSKTTVEGLLETFPKLIGAGKQHTYVETDQIRFVYQPLEGNNSWCGRPLPPPQLFDPAAPPHQSCTWSS